MRNLAGKPFDETTKICHNEICDAGAWAQGGIDPGGSEIQSGVEGRCGPAWNPVTMTRAWCYWVVRAEKPFPFVDGIKVLNQLVGGSCRLDGYAGGLAKPMNEKGVRVWHVDNAMSLRMLVSVLNSPAVEKELTEAQLLELIQKTYEESDGTADVLHVPKGSLLEKAIEDGEFDKMEEDPESWIDGKLPHDGDLPPDPPCPRGCKTRWECAWGGSRHEEST